MSLTAVKSVRLINPASEESLGELEFASDAEVENLLAASYSAAVGWRNTRLEERLKCLPVLAQNLRQARAELAARISDEMGKVLAESLAEMDKCIEACETLQKEFPAWLARAEYEISGRYSVRRRPLGVILGIMPWNFPLWQVARFALPALMCGNTVLIKHAPSTWGSALEIGKIFTKSFPPGAYGNLRVDVDKVPALIADPRVQGVSLTGSRRAGGAVAALAGQAIKKCVLELGGSDAYVILDDAEIEKAAEICCRSRLINAGQSCVAAKRFIVTAGVKKNFTEALHAQMSKAKWGNPYDSSVRIGPLARADLRAEVDRQVQQSVRQGASVALGGSLAALRSTKGYFYPPTILTGVVPGQAAFDEEVFGPVAAIIEATGETEAFELANRSRYGLGGVIFSRNVERARRLAVETMDCGMVWINDLVKSDVLVPFGGIKESGFGRELGRDGGLEFTNIKTIFA